MQGAQFSRNVVVWRHLSGAEDKDEPHPPLLSARSPHKGPGRGLRPSGRSASRRWPGAALPGSVRGRGFRQDKPGPHLTLCTVRPHRPLTRTLSPLSPRPALCSFSECHHLPLDMAVSVHVRLSTECQLQ